MTKMERHLRMQIVELRQREAAILAALPDALSALHWAAVHTTGNAVQFAEAIRQIETTLARVEGRTP